MRTMNSSLKTTMRTEPSSGPFDSAGPIDRPNFRGGILKLGALDVSRAGRHPLRPRALMGEVMRYRVPKRYQVKRWRGSTTTQDC